MTLKAKIKKRAVPVILGFLGVAGGYSIARPDATHDKDIQLVRAEIKAVEIAARRDIRDTRLEIMSFFRWSAEQAGDRRKVRELETVIERMKDKDEQ